MVKAWYVYALLDPRKKRGRKSSRVFYIGKGKGNRSQAHIRASIRGDNHNAKLSNKVNAITKEGLVYEVEFLFSSDNEQECLEKEIFWISFYGRDTLCNGTDGGEGMSGYKHSQSALDKIIASNKRRGVSEETRAKMSVGIKKAWVSGALHGCPKSEHTRALISAAHTGKTSSEEAKENQRKSHRERVISGKHDTAILVYVDGITDSLSSTSKRFRMSHSALTHWIDKGYTAQQIVDAWRISPPTPGHSLFPRKNKSGFTGVRKLGNKWESRITVNGIPIKIGSYPEILDAIIAYNDASIKYCGPHAYQNPMPH